MIMITPAQLKATNLIFNEHFELKVVNGLQRQQIERYKKLYEDELVADSLFVADINRLKVNLYSCELMINSQNKVINKKNRHIKWLSSYGIGSTLVILALCLL